MATRLRIFVVSWDLPRLDIASGDRRFVYLLKMLAEHHEVHFWSPQRSGTEQFAAQKYERDLQSVGVTVLPPWRGNLLWPLTLNVYDVAIFEFWHCAAWAMKELRRIQPWTYLIVDSVDVHFLREEAGLTRGIGDPLSVAERRQREIAAYREGDCVIVVTDDDRRALETVGGIKRQVVLPNVTVPRCRPPMIRGSDLLFVGGFWHAPNVDGITWFVKEILPLVKAEVPSVRFAIVGSNAPEEVRALGKTAGVDFIGYVEDTGPYLDRAAVSVAPLRFGAGMKGKVTEAMSAALAVVTTPVGAQGLAAEHGRHLLVGDTSKEMASHIIYLLHHPERAREIGENAQRFIEGLCGFEATVGKVKNMLAPALLRSLPWSAGLHLLTLGLTSTIGRELITFTRHSIGRLRSVVARAYRISR